MFDDFLRHGTYLRGWDPKTVAIYERAYAGFQAALGDAPTSGESQLVTKARLEAWVVWMRQAKRSPAYVNIHVRAMNSYLNWLHSEGVLKERLRLKQVPDPQKPIPMFSDSDIRKILSFKARRFSDRRLHTLLALLLDTGVRIDEALNVQEADVDFDNFLLTVVRGKGGKSRKAPFSPELRKLLFSFLQLRNRKFSHRGFVFCTRNGTRVSYRNTLRDMVRLCGKLGISGPRVSPHTLRHFFAVTYVRRGGDLYRLSRILGHSSLSTTQVYLRSMGVDVVAENHSRLSPLAPR